MNRWAPGSPHRSWPRHKARANALLQSSCWSACCCWPALRWSTPRRIPAIRYATRARESGRTGSRITPRQRAPPTEAASGRTWRDVTPTAATSLPSRCSEALRRPPVRPPPQSAWGPMRPNSPRPSVTRRLRRARTRLPLASTRCRPAHRAMRSGTAHRQRRRMPSRSGTLRMRARRRPSQSATATRCWPPPASARRQSAISRRPAAASARSRSVTSNRPAATARSRSATRTSRPAPAPLR